jgi:signal transduction histidine kinase
MSTQDQLTDAQQQNRLLARLLEVSLILNSNLAIAPLLGFIMDATCETTQCEASSILLYNRNSDELRFVASNSPGTDPAEMASIPVPMEGSIAGQIVRENRSIVIQDSADPRIYRGVDQSIGFQTRTLLGVPMSIKETVVGVLEAVNKRDGLWTEDDRDHLSILATQAAVAIQNAQQAQALQKAYDDLHQLDKLKNDFIAIASHELRTPLGVILGYASFLQEEAQGEASEHATLVLNSALHLRNLIEDLTNLRYLQLGKSELTRETTTVGSLIDAAQKDVESLTAAKGHTLKVDLTNADTLVSVDKLKIGMAMTNILNNAIKFTPSNGKISLSIEHRSHEVWIKVVDNGMGVGPEHIEKIFDEFYQAEDHMTRQHNGMGIGLSIARGMIDAHGGRIWVESEGADQGSTFIVALPVYNPSVIKRITKVDP